MKHSKKKPKPKKKKKTIDSQNEEEEFIGENMAIEEKVMEEIQQDQVRECVLLPNRVFL